MRSPPCCPTKMSLMKHFLSPSNLSPHPQKTQTRKNHLNTHHATQRHQPKSQPQHPPPQNQSQTPGKQSGTPPPMPTTSTTPKPRNQPGLTHVFPPQKPKPLSPPTHPSSTPLLSAKNVPPTTFTTPRPVNTGSPPDSTHARASFRIIRNIRQRIFRRWVRL